MKKLLIILGLSITFFSCNKDDDNDLINPVEIPAPDPTQPNTQTYQHMADSELLLWIGGEEINTGGMDVTDFYDAPDDLTDPGSVTLTFDQDSVEIFWNNTENQKHAYRNSNDSLWIYGSYEIGGNTYEYDTYLGIGTRYTLKLELAYSYISLYDPIMKYNQSYYGFQTFGSVVPTVDEQPLFSSPADMGATDTIMIFNRSAIYAR